EHLSEIQACRNLDHFVDEVSQRRIITESVIAIIQAKYFPWCAWPNGWRPVRCEVAALPGIAILGFFCICRLLEIPHERQQRISGDVHRGAFNPVEMIDAPKHLDVVGNRRAYHVRTIFARHGCIALAGPRTCADDHLAPEKSDKVAEFCGRAMKVAGAK